MLKRQLDQIKPEMDVCDVSGDKVGPIAQVYRHVEVAAGATGMPIGGPAPHDGVMEVRTGFLGLGPRLYIPFSAVQETLKDCLFLSKAKEEFERLGWHEQPLYLDRLRNID